MAKTTGMSDDHDVLSNEDMIGRLRESLAKLQSMATSHDEKIDAEILLAEQAIRRAIRLLKSTT